MQLQNHNVDTYRNQALGVSDTSVFHGIRDHAGRRVAECDAAIFLSGGMP